MAENSMAENSTAEPHDDELYIGYLPQAPPGIARHTRRTVLLLLVLGTVLALLLVWAQTPFAPSVFEYGVVHSFEGILREHPYPTLEVAADSAEAGRPAGRRYLVAPFKHGADDAVLGLDGRRVRLEGSLIYVDDQTMIEIVPESIEALPAAAVAATKGRSHGTWTLQGEIVDSKCHLGVMKPGELKPHRACAVRCISGGVPPLLLVRGDQGPAARLLLVDSHGRAVNGRVLDMVAEPVEIQGEVVEQDNLFILKADPETYRRLP